MSPQGLAGRKQAEPAHCAVTEGGCRGRGRRRYKHTTSTENWRKEPWLGLAWPASSCTHHVLVVRVIGGVVPSGREKGLGGARCDVVGLQEL